MFRRLFWFVAGASAGVWATTKVNRKLRRLAPDSIAAAAADRAIEAGDRVKLFARDVRDGMARRESELHDVLGVGTSTAELSEPRRRQALEHNTSYNRKDDH